MGRTAQVNGVSSRFTLSAPLFSLFAVVHYSIGVLTCADVHGHRIRLSVILPVLVGGPRSSLRVLSPHETPASPLLHSTTHVLSHM
ncbi:hypothetical protein EDB86DRAFT_615451 [Lactarius hatsudake]|nr:hypothetical protein EDB86DRAFT_615451 [Lactarius hatsudake]